MDSKLRHAAFNAEGIPFKDVRLDYAKPKKYKKGHRGRSQLKYYRCPSCGGMATMPCVLCLLGEDIDNRALQLLVE